MKRKHRPLKLNDTDVESTNTCEMLLYFPLCFFCDTFVFLFLWLESTVPVTEAGSAGHSSLLSKSEVVLNMIKRLDEHSYGRF